MHTCQFIANKQFCLFVVNLQCVRFASLFFARNNENSWRTQQESNLQSLPSEGNALSSCAMGAYAYYTTYFLFCQHCQHKIVQVAIKDSIRICFFNICPYVLDQLIWVQHIVANLATPFDFLLCCFGSIFFGSALFHFQFVQLRTQHFHSHFFVLNLATFVLTCHDSVCWQMCYTHTYH